ncbi:GNAT family N-acetyltransferase [Staphylococcus sp. IVB6238]|uniref:GNAT family N-acetyltransferase n=1 Tax=unclassified Staphylococcus TaxID=91994 RepID=UPI0021CFE00A|nr:MULTISPECIES: GNAT family N-acetyltransferase [unclassified Staphylococcus]UXR70829.1 GNAT family N-acetyltransferase [Staphylococcus sp. IVB6240]UXR73059.1 GNAT family N-acetyltransferase [Staphylococcus sp. IVB6238]
MRLATLADIEQIHFLVEEAKQLMQQDNNPQWDANYPVLEDFKKDIHEQALYVLDEDNIIKGFIVKNRDMPEWYDQFDWPLNREHVLVIHRLVASSRYPGTAQILMDYAISNAQQQQMTALLTDTFSKNQRAQKFFRKHHFIKIGEMQSDIFPFDKGEPFYAYYKILN